MEKIKYKEGDRVIIDGIEAEVCAISRSGYAYLVPLNDGDLYHSEYTLKGVVFAILNTKGKDRYGKRAQSMIKTNCGAV